MTRITRRRALGAVLTGAAAGIAAAKPVPDAGSPATGAGSASAATSSAQCLTASGAAWATLRWGAGHEGQRKADLGNGSFLNPILAGDHPDPSILKDGADYYLTCSSFDAYPGLVIWHSRDLVNWQPLTATLRLSVGSVWAPELIKHNDTYYLYTHGRRPDYRSLYVLTAQDIRGPWSDPVDLKLHEHIDPGHAVGEDGRRYLFLSGGDRVRLSDDGLSVDGKVEHVYEPWRYPEDWVVEGFAPEGPKVLRRGEWFYLITAVGGTAGPPTSHMVTVARSRSIHGPWENAPNNPVVHTTCASQKWWSRGHATAVEGPDGSWWLVYHGYENGFWTLGRQTLLDPIEWTADGWIVAHGGDLSTPLRKPLTNARAVAGATASRAGGPPRAVASSASAAQVSASTGPPHGFPLSDDFSSNKFGVQWAFYDPSPTEQERVRYEDRALLLRGKGTQPKDCSPLCFIAGELSYEVTVDIELEGAAQAGLLLFYNRRLYCGLGFDDRKFVLHRYGLEREQSKPAALGRRVHLRITNDRNIVTLRHSPDGATWSKFGVQMEVSG